MRQITSGLDKLEKLLGRDTIGNGPLKFKIFGEEGIGKERGSLKIIISPGEGKFGQFPGIGGGQLELKDKTRRTVLYGGEIHILNHTSS